MSCGSVFKVLATRRPGWRSAVCLSSRTPATTGSRVELGKSSSEEEGQVEELPVVGGHHLPTALTTLYWGAINELKLNYHTSGTLSFGISL